MASPKLMLYFRVAAALAGLLCALSLLLLAKNPIGLNTPGIVTLQILISIAGGIFLAAVLLIDLFKILFTGKSQK